MFTARPCIIDWLYLAFTNFAQFGWVDRLCAFLLHWSACSGERTDHYRKQRSNMRAPMSFWTSLTASLSCLAIAWPRSDSTLKLFVRVGKMRNATTVTFSPDDLLTNAYHKTQNDAHHAAFITEWCVTWSQSIMFHAWSVDGVAAEWMDSRGECETGAGLLSELSVSYSRVIKLQRIEFHNVNCVKSSSRLYLECTPKR